MAKPKIPYADDSAYTAGEQLLALFEESTLSRAEKADLMLELIFKDMKATQPLEWQELTDAEYDAFIQRLISRELSADSNECWAYVARTTWEQFKEFFAGLQLVDRR